MFHRLIERPTDIDRPGLVQAAKDVGLELETWQQCLDGAPDARIAADVASARELGIRSTPVSIIGVREGAGFRARTVVRGAKSFDVFAAAIDDALSSVGLQLRPSSAGLR
jgi:predicted DsbA family dithiol-disulfide isomerase